MTVMRVDRARLDRVFDPRSIAVVGDTARSGFGWLHRMQRFDGALSAVHTNPESAKTIEALGVACYPRIVDVP